MPKTIKENSDSHYYSDRGDLLLFLRRRYAKRDPSGGWEYRRRTRGPANDDSSLKHNSINWWAQVKFSYPPDNDQSFTLTLNESDGISTQIYATLNFMHWSLLLNESNCNLSHIWFELTANQNSNISFEILSSHLSQRKYNSSNSVLIGFT